MQAVVLSSRLVCLAALIATPLAGCGGTRDDASAGTIDVRTVAGRLGHADASVTLRVYAHALEARDRDMAQVLSSAVLGTSAPSS